MNFLKNSLILFPIALIAIIIFVVSPKLASADSSCPNVYGASCPSGNLSLDKKIKNPQTGEFVDTLSANVSTFLAAQDVYFRIEVKNTGNQELHNVKVQDKLPEYVDFLSGPGNYDFGTRTLNWEIEKLNAGESKLFDVKVRVKAGKDLPATGMNCVTNFAEARKDNIYAQDTSVFCIQTKILGAVTTLPKTGPAKTEIVIAGSLMMLALSVLLFKKYSI